MELLNIRKARTDELNAVIEFYWNLIDDMKNAQYRPGWEKGVYPSEDYLEAAIEHQELFVGMLCGKIVTAMIVNHSCNENYAQAPWRIEARAEEVMVLHTLGVSPAYSGRGYARQMVLHALDYARSCSQLTVRLDVLGTTKSAQELYKSIGFEHICTLDMFYEDTGVTSFELFEYVL